MVQVSVTERAIMPTRLKLQPAPVAGALHLDDYWVWDGSVIRGEDARYHMFASAWPKSLSFAHWVTNSIVIHASADTPLGPFGYEGVALAARGAGNWDGGHIHNPTIHKCGDMYLLFYSGTTYDGANPTPEKPTFWGSPQWKQAWANSRIGLATSSSVYGPWQRRPAPLVEPRPGKWDGVMTTNPAVCVHPDGRVLLLYKSIAKPYGAGCLPARFQLGVVAAGHYEGPYRRLQDDPVLEEIAPDHVEDMYIWRNGDGYEMVGKDMDGGITGEAGAGLHAHSDEGTVWRISQPALAYSRTVHWDDGSCLVGSKVERPQLLVEEGRPTHLYLTFATGGKEYSELVDSRIVVIPVQAD
jgi:hypothetical protein